MTIVTFVNPKGGVGKTTSAFTLAEYSVGVGLTVAVLDLDPNENMVHFEKTRQERGDPSVFTVFPRPNDPDDVLEMLEHADEKFDIVIVDLEGSKDKIATLALSQTSLAIVPLNGSAMEARQAASALKLIKSTSKIVGRDIPQRCLFTRVNAGISWKDEREVRADLESSGLAVFKARLEMRSPFTQIFRDSRTVKELMNQASVGTTANSEKYKNAKINADTVASEIVKLLLEISE